MTCNTFVHFLLQLFWFEYFADSYLCPFEVMRMKDWWLALSPCFWRRASASLSLRGCSSCLQPLLVFKSVEFLEPYHWPRVFTGAVWKQWRKFLGLAFFWLVAMAEILEDRCFSLQPSNSSAKEMRQPGLLAVVTHSSILPAYCCLQELV